MATERRTRINLYVGPKTTATRDDLAAMEASGDYVFEEKKDGFWCLAVVEGGEIKTMVSRTGLAFEPAETAVLLGLSVGGGSGRLIGELTADPNEKGEKCGTRRLHLFDVLDWNAIDLRDLPQTERREALGMVYGKLAFDRGVVSLVEQRTANIPAWFDEIIARGGEGIVAKKKTAKCRAANADGKIEEWVRVKPYRAVDMVVLSHGFAEKGTPNVDLGLWKNGKLVKIQTCVLPKGLTVGILPVGSVVEVVGFEIWPSGAVRHGQITRSRSDKLAESCTLD